MSRTTSAQPPTPPGHAPESAVRTFRTFQGIGRQTFTTPWETPSRHPVSTKQNLTLLFADIHGFTSFAEVTDPEDCLRILNVYFAVAAEAVHEFGGNVDKFQGDGIMATFAGVTENESHERRAVQCAVRIREAMQHLTIPELPLGRLQISIGISTGIAALGYVGSRTRREFTAIGDAVNVAHRLQTASQPGQILISLETRQGLGDDLPLEAVGELDLKGRKEPVTAFVVK
jgi:adenylate cyclase